MGLRLYFNIFATTQLFSPIPGEHKQVRERLQNLGLKLQTQLKNAGRIPSKKLPVNIKITYFVNKNNYDPNSLLIISYEIISILRLATVIQDVNNKTVKSISLTVSSKYVDLFTKEGCLVEFD